MAQTNTSIKLAERPVDGGIIPGRTFKAETSPAPTAEDLKDGQILVETLYLSIDPTMRGWLSTRRSYMPPVQIGETMRSSGVARVLASKSAEAKPGDIVHAMTGWTEVAVLSEGRFEPAAAQPAFKHPSELLGALGLTGLTAWYGMEKIGKPKAGELVVVSGAAGATGSVAGQIAKARGARVVGIAGTDEKCRWLKDELGFDVALNYKDAEFETKFDEATKDYIDVYWDNVGGDILDMALGKAQKDSRFVMCGSISQSNKADQVGPKNLYNITRMRILMQGFIILDHAPEFPRARQELAKMIETGQIKSRETIVKGGIVKAEQALVDLFNGVNTGKLVVEVKSP